MVLLSARPAQPTGMIALTLPTGPDAEPHRRLTERGKALWPAWMGKESSRPCHQTGALSE